MANVVVLGAGRVGRVIARDLSEDANLKVTMADANPASLQRLATQLGLETIARDLSDPRSIGSVVADFDLVIGALPGAMGLSAMAAVIAAKRPLIDISFMPEDPRHLDAEAKAANVAVFYDFGVAPGMSNLLIANGVAELGRASHARFYVGGLPAERRLPWEYQAPFSPIDVLEEYTRPARFKHAGKVMTQPALSQIEQIYIPQVGTLEGFLTDGLRSMLDTIDCPDIIEKTLRYPGHADKIRLLRDAGFFDTTELNIDGQRIRPIDVSFELLDKAWRQTEEDVEFTAMQIVVEGESSAGKQTITWNLLDRTDRVRRESSMARTTGFPAAIAARCLLDGTIDQGAGVFPPEVLGSDNRVVKRMLDELASRQVVYNKSVTGH